MTLEFKRSSFFLLILLLNVFSDSANSYAQSSNEIEVYLEFRHRGVINTVIISYYIDDEFFLPVSELFDVFQIENKVDGLSVSGKFSTEQIPYLVDLQRQTLMFDDQVIDLGISDFYLSDLDFYLPLRIYSQIFELDFSVEFNNLTLQLDTQKELPIIERALRSQKRNRTANLFEEQAFYDLKDGRNRKILDGGFVDYSLSTNAVNDKTSFNYNTLLGLQVLSGDLQGSLFGVYSNNSLINDTNNLRWRYVFEQNPIISRIIVGETNLNGVIENPYTGIRISNEPIEPRRLFDEFEIQGSTFPESEIELYLNNTLIDYRQSDESGNYRFLTPLFYGSTQLDVRIFGPTGQIIERTSRVQVPFTFTPKGKVDYNLNVGVLNNPLIGSTNRSFVTQANASFGLAKWLTSKIGMEYYDQDLEDNKPVLTSTLSSRILSNYIFTLEGVTSGYYRSSLNVIYPNSTSLTFDYIDFITKEGVFNTTGNDKQINANVFIPFQLFKLPLNFRTSFFSRFRDNISLTTFRTDLVSRFNKFSYRVGYIDQLVDTFNPFESSSASKLETSATYNFSRNPNLPFFLRGTFLRGQLRFLPSENKIQSSEILFSRSVLKKGRFQIAINRNFIGQYNSFRFNFVIDLDKVRTNTTSSILNDGYNLTQNIRGSIGFDTNYNNLLFTSRNQVGRSAAVVNMFIDNNNNNIFDENIDEKIDEGNIRINRTGSSRTQKNGYQYYTQLQPYFRYNMEMNTASINNPMLVPQVDKFSIITDPNTYKRIDIPFYMAGLMEGGVYQVYADSLERGIGGLKVLLVNEFGDLVKEIRTFSDGSFYEYPIPPGKYSLSVDENQLNILQSNSNPEIIEFEVNAVQNGDFIEGLAFKLVPRSLEEESPEAEQQRITIAQVTDEIKTAPEVLDYSQEIFVTIDDALRYLIQAQNAFYSKNVNGAFRLVSESLELFETAQGHALKGSFYYFEGNIEQAQRHWEQALRFNPDLYIPDMETLEDRVNTSASD